MNVKLIEKPMSTVKTWILLANLTLANGSPLVGSISDFVAVSKSISPISTRGLSRGLRDLEELGMVEVERRGNVSIISVRTKNV
jgi:hypothetical protein